MASFGFRTPWSSGYMGVGFSAGFHAGFGFGGVSPYALLYPSYPSYGQAPAYGYGRGAPYYGTPASSTGYTAEERWVQTSKTFNALQINGAWDGQVKNYVIPFRDNTGRSVQFFRDGQNSFQVAFNNPSDPNKETYLLRGDRVMVDRALMEYNKGDLRGIAQYVVNNGTPVPWPQVASAPPASQISVAATPPTPSPPAPAQAQAPTTSTAPREPVTATPLPPMVASAPPRASMRTEMAAAQQRDSHDPNLGHGIAKDVRDSMHAAKNHKAGTVGAGYGRIVSAGPQGGDAFVIARDAKTGEVSITPMDPVTFKPKDDQKLSLGTDPKKLDDVLQRMETGGIAAVQKLFQQGQRSPAMRPGMAP